MEQGPILALAWDQDHSELWTGTTAATAQRWHLDAVLPQPPAGPPQQVRTSVDLQQVRSLAGPGSVRQQPVLAALEQGL